MPIKKAAYLLKYQHLDYFSLLWRRHPDLNRGIKVLQTLTLPLGYSAVTWWLDQESNQGHEDFQSSALPTELSSQKKPSDNLLSRKVTLAVPLAH